MKTAFDLEMERLESENERLARQESRFIGGLLIIAFVLGIIGWYFA